MTIFTSISYENINRLDQRMVHRMLISKNYPKLATGSLPKETLRREDRNNQGEKFAFEMTCGY
jgi:hypothetical protein